MVQNEARKRLASLFAGAPPQDVVGGCGLLALAGLATYLTIGLDNGTASAIGPGLLPHVLALLMAVSGVILVARGFRPGAERMVPVEWRGPLLVLAAVLAFSLTIRPTEIGPLVLPGLGLVVAGPLAIILSGIASPNSRLLDLVILSLFLTGFCILLFGDLLSLPLPILPPALTATLVDQWSTQMLLRITVGIYLSLGVALLFVRRMLPKAKTQKGEV